jgi:hypothetical protein
MFVFPRLRLQEFNECRVRKPVQGSLIDEQTDVMLTEPVVPQMQRWMERAEHIVFQPATVHASTELPGIGRFISVCYYLMTASKSDAVHLMYGR